MLPAEKIQKSIIKVLHSSKNPVATNELVKKTGYSWHTINSHCLKLQLKGKVTCLTISKMNLWGVKK